MLKYKVMALILLTAVFISGEAYCQEVSKDRQISTVTGTVTYVDVDSGVINLQTGSGKILFYISVESELYRFTHHIVSIEIFRGDPVVIQYITSPSGRNTVLRLVDKKPDSI